MATLPQQQHVCNRSSSSGTDSNLILFRNDANNVNALQRARLQKKLAEEAARRQKEQLDAAAKSLAAAAEDTEKVKKERDTLREINSTLNRTLKTKDSELEIKNSELVTKNSELVTKNGALEQAREQVEKLKKEKEDVVTEKGKKETELANVKKSWSDSDQELKKANTAKETLENQARSLNLKINEMEERLPNTSRQNNCLPFQYHGSTVLIINLASQLALDGGKENGTKTHGWDADMSYVHQIFNLSKVSGSSDPHGYWTITRKMDGKKVYVPLGNITQPLLGTASGKQDCWYIGRGSASRVGTWVIENAEWGTILDQPFAKRDNGSPIISYPRNDNNTANWIIVPISFTG